MTKETNKIKKTSKADVSGVSSGVVGSASNYADNVVFSSQRGHGYAGEKVNNLHDNFMGKDAKIVGADNAKNGADRLVNGTYFQTKYCNSGSKCISECFENGKLRYVNADGTPMQIEVPSDMYDPAVQAMKERIKKGQLEGVNDPEKANEIVRRGNYTYEQAKNIAKCGTIESLGYDAANGFVIAGTAMGVSSAISFAVAIWNKEEVDIALKNACYDGLRIGSIAWVSSILTAQVGRTGIEQSLRGSTDWAVNQMGYKATGWIANSARSGSNIYGGAAKNNVSKLLRSNLVAGAVTTIVLSSADFVRMFDGRVSGKQVFKNMSTTAAGIAGGTGGWMGGASAGAAVGSAIPIIGTIAGGIVGGVLGSLAGGSAATAITSGVLDSFIEDDAKEMLKIVEVTFGQLAEDYLLAENEAKLVIDEFQSLDMLNILRDMYASSDRSEFARNFLEPSCENQLRQRPKIKLPSNEKIIKTTRCIIEELIDEEAATTKAKLRKRQKIALLGVLALAAELEIILEFGLIAGGVIFLIMLLIIKTILDNKKTSKKTEKIKPERPVGIWLALGIILVPYVFSFFTLRNGYSTISRYVAMGWLGTLILGFLHQPIPTVSNPVVIPSIHSSSTSQQASNDVQTSDKDIQEAAQSKLDNGRSQQIGGVNKRNGLYTKYGTLIIKNIDSDKKGLFIESKLIFEREGGYLGVEKDVIYHLADSEVAVIYSDEGGSGTPPSYAFLTLMAGSSPKLSDWFNPDIDLNPVQDGNKITIDLGHSNGNHNILTYQNNQMSIQSLSDKEQNADDDTCNYLYNGIYVEYVHKQECDALPQSVSGMATERGYNSYEKDPRLKLEAFQQISNSSCKNNEVIRYSDFKKLVCEGGQLTPTSTSNTSNTQAVDQISSNQKQFTAPSATSFIKEMITSALLQEKRIVAQENIEALPKPKRGNKKEARKLNDQSLILAKELNYQGALPLMIDAYNLDSADVEIINNLAYLQIKTSDFANAKKSLMQTLTLKPNRYGAWADLGSVFAAEGDEESARNCYINYYNYAKNQDKALKYLNTEDPENPNLIRVKTSAYNAIIAISSVGN